MSQLNTTRAIKIRLVAALLALAAGAAAVIIVILVIHSVVAR
jgi:hypothetical protein